MQNILKKDKNEAGYVPLPERMDEWWEAPDNALVEGGSGNSTDAQIAKQIKSDLSHIDEEKRLALKFQIYMILWGKGKCRPENYKYHRKIFNLNEFDSRSKILDLNAGLGYNARMIAKKQFNHVDCVCSDPDFLEKFKLLNRVNETSNMVHLVSNDIENDRLPTRKYDLVMGREVFFRHKNKQHILEKAVDGLTPKGWFVFTDFVVEDDGSAYSIVKNWSENETGKIYPVSESVYTKILRSFEMKLLPVQNFSSAYVKMVNKGWMRLQNFVEANQVDEDFVNVMVRESEIWLSRVKALRSGKMKLVQFRATF